MFPGAFTRGNSVAFSFGEARWYTADGAPVAWSLTIISDTHRHRLTHLSSRAPSIWLSRHILPLRCNSEHTLPPWKNTTPNSSHLSLAPPLICARLIFTACALLRPSCLKWRVFRLFCVETGRTIKGPLATEE